MQVKDFSPIAKLVNLKNIDISESNIEDISAIYDVPKLERIQFFKAKIKNINGIKKLKNLKSIALSYNEIEVLILDKGVKVSENIKIKPSVR